MEIFEELERLRNECRALEDEASLTATMERAREGRFWASPKITDTFLNAERARRVRDGKHPKKVWSGVQA